MSSLSVHGLRWSLRPGANLRPVQGLQCCADGDLTVALQRSLVAVLGRGSPLLKVGEGDVRHRARQELLRNDAEVHLYDDAQTAHADLQMQN